MPHYLKWRETVADMIEGSYGVVEMTTAYPPAPALHAQKPHLLD